MVEQSSQIRILIADDHPVVCKGLSAMIHCEPDMEVVAQASNGPEALVKFLGHLPDVAIINLRMPHMNGIQVTKAIIEKMPKARVIILSTFGGDESVYQSLQAGAKAYLQKTVRRDKLVECIRTVYEGSNWLSPELAAKLMGRTSERGLTPKEKEVLSLMVAGKTNKEIGKEIDITEGTVKIHVNRIFKKLKANGRAEAINTALRRGIVTLE